MVYLRIGIIGLVLGQLLAGIITFSLLSFAFLRSKPITFNLAGFKNSLKISLPLTPRIFFGVIGNHFDKYLIGLLNTIGGVGVFSIAQRIANITFTFMTAIQNVFSPEVYKRMFEMGEEGKKSIGQYLTPFLYVSISIAVLISLFSEEIISVLTPVSYHGAIEITIILSMLYGIYFFGKQPQLIYMKKTYITSIMSLVRIGVNIGINIPFIAKWGVMGAAWGSLLAEIISGSISFTVSQYHYKIEWEYRKIGSIFLVFFGSAIMMILLMYFGVDYWIRVIVKVLLLSTYLILGMRLNILTKQNFILAKSIFFQQQLKINNISNIKS